MKKEPSLLKIALFVMAVHAAAMLFVVIQAKSTIKLEPRAKLVVQTISLEPKKEQMVAVSTPGPVPVIIPEPTLPEEVMEPETFIESIPEPKEEKPIPKKEPPKQLPPKKIEDKKEKPKQAPPKKTIEKKEKPKETKTLPKKEPKKEKEVVKKTTSKKQEKPAEPKKDPKEEAARIALQAKKRELLAKAQESIAKIDNKSGNLIGKPIDLAPVLKPIGSLQIDGLSMEGKPGSYQGQERSYIEELSSLLKLKLRLPEYGEVKVKLTLLRSGQVDRVVIVSSASDANRKHIEKALPKMVFPNFGNNFENQMQYTFQITLSNE